MQDWVRDACAQVAVMYRVVHSNMHPTTALSWATPPAMAPVRFSPCSATGQRHAAVAASMLDRGRLLLARSEAVLSFRSFVDVVAANTIASSSSSSSTALTHHDVSNTLPAAALAHDSVTPAAAVS